MKKQVAIYGNTKLLRMYCRKCKAFSFVVDKTFQCCGKEGNDSAESYKRMSNASGMRKCPPQKIAVDILKKQENRCKYCDIKFGEIYFRDTKRHISKIAWDHFVPFAYLQENPYDNWVASCGVCNSIKSSKMFETIEEVRNYVQYSRKKKGISYISDVSTMPNDDEESSTE